MDKSEKFWNRLSKNYNKNAKDQTFDQILARTPKYLKHDDVVLDFACATGLYSFKFADRVKEIHAFDISSQMIAAAEIEANKRGEEGVNFSRTTIFDGKFKEGSFDVILAFNILLYFEDSQKVLDRMHKLLKPNGIIVTSTACLAEKGSIAGFFAGIVICMLKTVRILPYLKFLKIKELETSIVQSRFDIIEGEVIMQKPAVEYFIAARKVD